jgi:hypothetical protein
MVLFGIIAIIATIFFISMIKEESGDAFNALPFIIIPALIIWGVVENADYREGKSVELAPTEVSIMCDDDVCIIRYGEDFQHTYDSKKEYDAISDSNFVLVKTTQLDILGEDNGPEFEFKIKD